VEKLQLPTDPVQAREAIEQWEKVLAFRNRMKDLTNAVYFTEFASPESFREVFESDLQLWLANPSRPWVTSSPGQLAVTSTALVVPNKYYESIEREFRRLDISGIDNDRAFEIPLSEIYVRLRVMFAEDNDDTSLEDNDVVDIQTALPKAGDCRRSRKRQIYVSKIHSANPRSLVFGEQSHSGVGKTLPLRAIAGPDFFVLLGSIRLPEAKRASAA
jgi:hypothetical protein